jgi:hypothetical protein
LTGGTTVTSFKHGQRVVVAADSPHKGRHGEVQAFHYAGEGAAQELQRIGVALDGGGYETFGAQDLRAAEKAVKVREVSEQSRPWGPMAFDVVT